MDDMQTGQPAPDTGAGDTATGGPVCESCGHDGHAGQKCTAEGCDHDASGGEATAGQEAGGAAPAGGAPSGGDQTPAGQ